MTAPTDRRLNLPLGVRGTTLGATNDVPRDTLARATLVAAGRALAAALGSPAEAAEVGARVQALERAVAAYVEAYGTGMAPRAVSGMVASRVRSALGTGDEAACSAAVVGRVVDIVRRSATAIAGQLGAVQR